MNVGDSFDILAFALAIIASGGSNLIPSGYSNFSGWTAFMGSSVTIPYLFKSYALRGPPAGGGMRSLRLLIAEASNGR